MHVLQKIFTNDAFELTAYGQLDTSSAVKRGTETYSGSKK